MRYVPSSAEQYRTGAHRAKQAAREVLALAFEIVIDHVHPANLGALPPSPSVLQNKALDLGIISHKDVCALAFE